MRLRHVSIGDHVVEGEVFTCAYEIVIVVRVEILLSDSGLLDQLFGVDILYF
jgi:hypothetical protein